MKLSRTEQDMILLPIVSAFVREHEAQCGYRPSSTGTLRSFRAALRLDDPVLNKLILTYTLTGAKFTWRSLPDADRRAGVVS